MAVGCIELSFCIVQIYLDKFIFAGIFLCVFSGPLAQLVEQRTLNPSVEGSIPSRLTIFLFLCGGYSSVGRAPGCGPGGRGFKSHYSPHFLFMVIKETNTKGLRRLRSVLGLGGLSILPAFTIYGFSAFLFDKYANEKIFRLKKRSKVSPFIVIADKQFILDAVCDVDMGQLEFFLDKGITVIAKTKLDMPAYAAKDGKSAFRIANTYVLKYLTSFFPITSTSINISGKTDVNNIKILVQRYRNAVDVIVNGKIKNVVSTIVELKKDKVVMIRKGCCFENIKERL